MLICHDHLLNNIKLISLDGISPQFCCVVKYSQLNFDKNYYQKKVNNYNWFYYLKCEKSFKISTVLL